LFDHFVRVSLGLVFEGFLLTVGNLHVPTLRLSNYIG